MHSHVAGRPAVWLWAGFKVKRRPDSMGLVPTFNAKFRHKRWYARGGSSLLAAPRSLSWHAEPMTSNAGIDFEKVHDVVLSTRAAMLEMPDEPFPGAKRLFPAVWCEHASIAVARVLHERELGDGPIVTAGLPGDASGHAWLKLRDDSGLLYCIDVTLDQFAQWRDPHIGYGVTPAAARFTEPRYAGPWHAWPVIRSDNSFAVYGAQVAAFMAASR